MAGGAAAAVCGARIGSRIAKTGEARRRLVTAQDEIVDSFLNIFTHCQGSSQERLQRALMRIPQTNKGVQYNVNYPTKEDLDFMSKVADINRNGEVSSDEATFAFRVWLCWKKLYPRITAMFDGLDRDGNGTLDAVELEPYMVQLNDGEEVCPDEVRSVIHRADSNRDGSLDKSELTFATAVWYTDIGYKKVEEKKFSNRVSRASKAHFKAAQENANSWLKRVQDCGRRCKTCCRRSKPEDDFREDSTVFRNSDISTISDLFTGPAGSDDKSRSSTSTDPCSFNRCSEASKASTGSPQSNEANRSRSESDPYEAQENGTCGAQSYAQEKHGAGVGNLEETEQAKLARDREVLAQRASLTDIPEDQRIVPARNKDAAQNISIVTGSTTATTGDPPSGAPSETWSDSLDRGYPEPPPLLIINTSDNAELMHDDFSLSPSEMATPTELGKVGL